MRKLLVSTLFFLNTFFLVSDSLAQIIEPVHWKFSVEQSSPSEATLIFSVKLDVPWHIYSQTNVGGIGLPLEFIINEDKSKFERVGGVVEPTPKEEYEPTEKVTLKYFEKSAVFKQKIKIKSDKPFKISGTVTHQACNDEGCLAPTPVEFSFDLNANQKSQPVNEKSNNTEGSNVTPDTSKVATAPANTNSDTSNTEATTANQGTSKNLGSYTLSNDVSVLEPGCGPGETEHEDVSNLLSVFVLCFAGGFVALLTPCVFPMIPMTVSFFTKRSGTRAKGIRNALTYAGSIIVIYVILGLVITAIFGPSALNALASNSFFNMLFFIVFVIFALSFFGAFEIVLPSAWVNKADSASEKGGLIGIFFMAFTLSLVSFSCTGPIIGTLLVQASQGGFGGPAVGMFGFSLALAIPFALFAMFPGWLSSLPKSGSWLNTVKVSLGFLELALAMKFLSNVDLAYHWGMLKREIFIALWIIIFGMLGFYLLGKLKFSHDSDLPHISTGRLIFAVLTFSFTLYMVPGLWGAPLNLISGFPPPEFYKVWKTSETECPHDLTCFHDLDEGMAYARTQGKPVMIDFTGWNCVNCRRMEDKVWPAPEVIKHLREDYILVSLYVDDKKALPESEFYQSKILNKTVKTTGDKWSDLQASVFNKNAQPLYVLIDHQGKLLAKPKPYTPDPAEYASFLAEGLCRFKNRAKAGS